MLFCSEEISDQVWPSGLTVQPTIYLVEQKFMAIHFNTDVTDKLRCSYSPAPPPPQKNRPPCTTTKKPTTMHHHEIMRRHKLPGMSTSSTHNFASHASAHAALSWQKL
jgi:hypothetical protein